MNDKTMKVNARVEFLTCVHHMMELSKSIDGYNYHKVLNLCETMLQTTRKNIGDYRYKK